MIAIERLAEQPYASVVCYPQVNKRDLLNRLRQLERLSVTSLEFAGKKQILNLPILGIGCVGIVVAAYKNHEKVALKIRRVDSDRSEMQRESNMLKKANSVNVGPSFIGVSKDFLLMQFVEGDLLPGWLAEDRSAAQVKRVLRDILGQCWRLDSVLLDHGELSHAPKHIIIRSDGRPFIVDFETASVNRRPANVTSICQFLFMNGVAKEIAKKIGSRNLEETRKALKFYKKCRNLGNFLKVLRTCGL